MPQATKADVSKLVSQLRIRINPKHRILKNPGGSIGKFKTLRYIVTGLIKYERIELNFNKADEARGYAERLISDAIRHGDRHAPTMEMADYWLDEKQLVHKLFKVLVPRFQNCNLSYTKLYRAPKLYPEVAYPRSVLELRGNPFPSLVPDLSNNRNLIHNILLEEAKKDYRAQKYAEITETLSVAEIDGEKLEEEKDGKCEDKSESSTSCSSVDESTKPAENQDDVTKGVLKETQNKPESSN